MIEELTGAPVTAFVGVTIVLMGFAAFMTGQGLANAWRPPWLIVLYSVLLGIADRFLLWALGGAEILTLSGFVIETAVLMAICFAAYRTTLARRMITQYPWLYERAGLFTWRRRADGG